MTASSTPPAAATGTPPTRRAGYRFFERLRVRWAEIDSQQIVFNGHYLMYFDTAIAGYWRALAMPYHDTMTSLGGDLFVRKAEVDYLASARYDDVLDVAVRCGRIGRSSMIFEGAVFLREKALVTGTLTYVYADPVARVSKPVPEPLRRLLERYEQGERMVDVRVGTWGALQGDAQPIRTTVFVGEQGIPADMEWDDADATAVHAVAYNGLGLALGTGRLLEHVPGVAKIGRMAVLPAGRSSGIGRAVLDALLDAARQRGDREAILHAQIEAAPFYERAGFARRGDTFEEAGITHVEMIRAL